MTKISLSFVIALIVTALFVAVGIAAIALSRRTLRRARNDDFVLDGGLALVGGWATVVITLGLAAFGLFPYDMEYHRFKHVEGTVQSVESRFLADGKATTQSYAVQLADSQTYRCDDTRCSLLKSGDSVSFWCIREWQYASTSGWACRFDGTTRP